MNRLKELRIENNLTMKDAAKRLGLPYTTYVNYEKEQREPNSEILIKAAKSYGVTVDYLIGNVIEPYFYLDNKRILDEINDDGQEKPATKDDELNTLKLPSNVSPVSKMRLSLLLAPFGPASRFSLRKISKVTSMMMCRKAKIVSSSGLKVTAWLTPEYATETCVNKAIALRGRWSNRCLSCKR